MMRQTSLFLLLAVIFSTAAFSQNYLRILDPDDWSALSTNEPGWEEYNDHGMFKDITIVTSPQGIYTQVEIFVTIAQVEPLWWGDFAEAIWQFDLPPQTIVHDSWLWVGEDIIKADVVDYWTALATYEDIVDRNQDPSFFYILPDGRYEIRIFPIEIDFDRRIKLSFLVPAKWSANEVTTNLLGNLFNSTDYPIEEAGIAMIANDEWGVPNLIINEEVVPMTETTVGGSGQTLHYHAIEGDLLAYAEKLEMSWDAPFTDNSHSFIHTYEDNGEQFYQLAYVPDWTESYQDPNPENVLFLVDYEASKTTISIEDIKQNLQAILGEHFSSQDTYNVAVATTSGIVFLDEIDWLSADLTLNQNLAAILELQDTSNLQLLLQEGLAWATARGDANKLYLLAANDDYYYPPVAENVFASLNTASLPALSFNIVDYQNENISVVYYENEVYMGNGYLYGLLNNAFAQSTLIVPATAGISLVEVLTDFFPSIELEAGTVDFNVNLANGLCYERYTLSSSTMNAENRGILLQTGKYLGDFPMEVEGYLVTEDNHFTTINTSLSEEDVLMGDTLMREIWYGKHLPQLMGEASSNADREAIIDLSITERILTPLTAFLALEPEQGGEPCISCLYNNGEIILIATDDKFDLDNIEITVSPNPVMDQAVIRLPFAEGIDTKDWSAQVYSTQGALMATLTAPVVSDNQMEWTWRIDSKASAGIYYCRITSPYGEKTVKIVVV